MDKLIRFSALITRADFAHISERAASEGRGKNEILREIIAEAREKARPKDGGK